MPSVMIGEQVMLKYMVHLCVHVHVYAYLSILYPSQNTSEYAVTKHVQYKVHDLPFDDDSSHQYAKLHQSLASYVCEAENTFDYYVITIIPIALSKMCAVK